MISQKRIALKNVGRNDPERIEEYLKAGGYKAMQQALKMPSEKIIDDLTESGLRGRGGAGFSAGLKERFAFDPKKQTKYVVCNADEGEPGTFKDRIIMEQDPHLYIEGMIISAYAIGAARGFIYIRGEYHRAIEMARRALASARARGFLGDDIMGSGFSFNIEVKPGAGSYLCGEELTLLESLEGKRGYPRIKPPYPAQTGLFGQPTLINNVETLALIPAIIANGPQWFRQLGTSNFPGTKIFTVSGDVRQAGFFEVEMGVTLRELIYGLAGGIKDGKAFKSALLGGAAGTFVPHSFLDVAMDSDSLSKRGATLGSGAVIVMSQGRPFYPILHAILLFFEHESCGKCVPCRVGTRQLRLQLEALKTGQEDRDKIWESMVHQSDLMRKTSLCPLGQSPALPIHSAVRHFRDAL